MLTYSLKTFLHLLRIISKFLTKVEIFWFKVKLTVIFDRVVMLESHLVHSGTLTESEGADLYILAGHEASY